ncbi:MAG TPA: NAD(P)H-dependent oxidoreductase [Thermomicrobiales bacterium]|nr:NAD(P)H-dependent oxidoreductase [Thermomicrobiales bacterium]
MTRENGHRIGSEQPRLLIVVGSTRPGRVGLPVAEWFTARAEAHGGFEVVVADLAKIDLPLMDEPHHPRLGQYTKQHTKDWSALVDSADAFVFVTPEYNHAPPAPLINAIDYLNAEWGHKPVGFVSYGGVSGGTRAVAILKQIVTVLKMMPLAEMVNLPFVAQVLQDGELRPNEITETAATTMLDSLVRWSTALATLRTEAAAPAGR